MDLATLYFKLGPKCPSVSGQMLTIDGRPVRFLQTDLLERCNFSEVKLKALHGHALEHAMELELFAPWRLRMLVVTLQIGDDEDPNQVKGNATRQLIDHFGQQHCSPLYFYSCLSTNRERSQGFVSMCLHGSQAAGIKQAREDGGTRNLYDAKGFALISERPQLARYQRLCVLYALALAYQEQINTLLSRLRDALIGDDDSALQQLRGECLRFMALYYFDNPVPTASAELHQSWRDLADALRLPGTHQELNSQLANIAQIVAIAQQRQPTAKLAESSSNASQKAGKCRCSSAWLAALTLLLMFFALTQLTPGEIESAWRHWQQWFVELID